MTKRDFAPWYSMQELSRLLNKTAKAMLMANSRGSKSIPPLRKMGREYVCLIADFEEWVARLPKTGAGSEDASPVGKFDTGKRRGPRPRTNQF